MNLNKEQELFFEALRYAVQGKPFGERPLTEEEWKRLYELSNRFDLAHLVGYALEQKEITVPEEVEKHFQKQQLIAMWRYEQLERLKKIIAAELDKAGVHYIFLKGTVIRPYYPEPWLRTSCDIDVLVRESDYQTALNALVSREDCKLDKESYAHAGLIFSSGMHAELHPKLVQKFPQIETVMDNVWDEAERVGDDTHECRMPDGFFFCYIFAHMAKHAVHSGSCGIRQLLDLWVIRNRMNIPFSAAEPYLETAGLLPFAKKMCHVSDVLFDDAPCDETTEAFLAFLLSGGVYGTLETTVAVRRKPNETKFHYTMSRLFPKYSMMRERNPILKKHKWLLPWCWMMRICQMLFKEKRNAALQELSINRDMSDADGPNVEQILKKFDLNGIIYE